MSDMGRKKGRQSGEFGSKSMRAANETEWKNRILEERPRQGYSASGVSRALATPRSPIHARRPLVQTTLLRHLIQDRQKQDLLQYQLIRQRRNRSIIPEQQQQSSKSPKREGPDRNDVGWLLEHNETINSRSLMWIENEPRLQEYAREFSDDTYHDHFRYREHGSLYAATIFPKQNELSSDQVESLEIQNKVPSLVTLCVQQVSRPNVLQHYIEDYGLETIHSLFSTFQPSLLTSIQVSTVTLSQAPVSPDSWMVMAHHSHLERLCATGGSHDCASSSTIQTEYFDSLCRHCHSMSQVLSKIIDSSYTQILGGLIDTHEAVDHWEDVALSDDDEKDEPWKKSMQFARQLDAASLACTALTRLELLDIPYLDPLVLTTFLAKCPKLTHLRLTNVFHSYSGPLFLMQHLIDIPMNVGLNAHYEHDHPVNTIWGSEDDQTNKITKVSTTNGLPLIPGLQMLDLSHNSWIHDSLLKEFARKWLLCFLETPNHLHNINVSGCDTTIENIFWYNAPKGVNIRIDPNRRSNTQHA